MANKRLSSILTLTGLALFLGACGDSTQTLPPYYNVMGGFGVVASDPMVRDTYVPRDISIRVQLNEAVDQASLAGSFTFRETTGKTTNDVTRNLSVSLSDANRQVVLTPIQPLALNANYRLTLSTAIRSVSGKNMVGSFDLVFSTGAGYGEGLGVNNDPANPPSVREFRRDIFNGSCLGITVRFSEDLISYPIGWVDVSGFFGLLPSGGQPLDFFPTYDNRYDYWSADIGCGCSYFNLDGHYDIKITDAIDNSEDRMQSEYNTDFGIPFLSSC